VQNVLVASVVETLDTESRSWVLRAETLGPSGAAGSEIERALYGPDERRNIELCAIGGPMRGWRRYQMDDMAQSFGLERLCQANDRAEFVARGVIRRRR
jgi:hypothetical protein